MGVWSWVTLREGGVSFLLIRGVFVVGRGGYRTTMDAWVWVVSVVLKGVPGIVGMSNLKPITKC